MARVGEGKNDRREEEGVCEERGEEGVCEERVVQSSGFQGTVFTLVGSVSSIGSV